MAHKKGQGSTRNGRDSKPKMLGIKATHGKFVTAGSILVRQRGTAFLQGTNVHIGRDYTFNSLIDGFVCHERRRRRGTWRVRISVYPSIYRTEEPSTNYPELPAAFNRTVTSKKREAAKVRSEEEVTATLLWLTKGKKVDSDLRSEITRAITENLHVPVSWDSQRGSSRNVLKSGSVRCVADEFGRYVELIGPRQLINPRSVKVAVKDLPLWVDLEPYLEIQGSTASNSEFKEARKKLTNSLNSRIQEHRHKLPPRTVSQGIPVRIGIIDTGIDGKVAEQHFDPKRTEFKICKYSDETISFPEISGWIDASGPLRHGTSVASIIGSKLYGLIPDSEIFIRGVDTDGDSLRYSISSASEAFKNLVLLKVDIICFAISRILPISSTSIDVEERRATLRRMISICDRYDIPVIASVGNATSKYTVGSYIGEPAAGPSAYSAGAVNSDKSLRSRILRGDCDGIYQPQLVTGYYFNKLADVLGAAGKEGSSYATAYITGLAACLMRETGVRGKAATFEALSLCVGDIHKDSSTPPKFCYLVVPSDE